MPAGSGAPTIASSPLVTSAPVETPQSTSLSPVYWMGENADNVFLYREFRSAEDLGDPITTAVNAALSLQPLDPDYFNPWRPASKVGASITNGSVITLDISSDAFEADVDAGIAERAVQQLVYTATAAAANAGLSAPENPLEVEILVDGHRGYQAFGHVQLGGLMARNPELSAPIWVIDPQQDASLDGRLEVYGRAVAFGSELSWQVARVDEDGAAAGNPVESGSVAISAPAGESGEFRFGLDLPAGAYRLEVFHAGQQDAEAPGRNTDSKAFTVK
ncbi:Gmad2 immunoglobulin-like domain-containing protein [Crystallibacter crystallopoietes]|nr:Gmad2 immunoglobulin-like domain-containing protein [Arthrobacter crystallopoietes]